mmetsp:Transcript_1709/g.2446  ORF Transcript_1709/g.2446 Transcript_1709/m.2446 type:complete len:214 (-) Transcript_1709:243-884(-)|eukprot:CAMPEP_0198137334 /NCGR_PEP_ID=MMETSP1443-20131203/848_1 /TAXON_ID=186043 /ORGANISM="Entomoneis sp., Strain CCMP2396" /LENGTH=213 /DNA_ID=CAMNT_0043798737 /DNA_START=98 /DNA_END=739 /DNA_ORIENTATION=+
MKTSALSLFCLSLLPSASLAFVVGGGGTTAAFRQASTSLFAQADATEMIQAAMEATKEFGIESSQARVLWDTVEEMRFNNSPATKGGLDKECEIEEDASQSEICADYEKATAELMASEKIAQLEAFHNDHENKVDNIDAIVQEMIELSKQAAAAGEFRHEDSAEMKKVIDEAEATALAATKEFGATSKEARLAWETYEDVAASGVYNAVGKDA